MDKTSYIDLADMISLYNQTAKTAKEMALRYIVDVVKRNNNCIDFNGKVIAIANLFDKSIDAKRSYRIQKICHENEECSYGLYFDFDSDDKKNISYTYLSAGDIISLIGAIRCYEILYENK
jgi:hypothetical protein